VLEIRDIWPESIVAVGAMRKASRSASWNGWRARLPTGRRDHLLTRGFVPHIAARCGTRQDRHFHERRHLSAFTRSDDGAEAKRKLGLEGKFVGAYSARTAWRTGSKPFSTPPNC